VCIPNAEWPLWRYGITIAMVAALLITSVSRWWLNRKIGSRAPVGASCAGHSKQRIGHGSGQSGLLEGDAEMLLRIQQQNSTFQAVCRSQHFTEWRQAAGGHHRHGAQQHRTPPRPATLKLGQEGSPAPRYEASPTLCVRCGRSSSDTALRTSGHFGACSLRNGVLAGPCVGSHVAFPSVVALPSRLAQETTLPRDAVPERCVL